MANNIGTAIHETLYPSVPAAIEKARDAEPDTMYRDLRRYGAQEEGLMAWLTHKIRKHMESGDMSALATYVGMVRASWAHVPPAMRLILKAACTELRADGRTVTLREGDPRKWISQSDGTSPRW